LNKKHGIFQCVPNESPISKYDLLVLFEENFPGNRKINRIENKLVDKSLIPELGDSELKIASYKTMIVEMREFIEKHRNLYKNY
jgi:dTDP-4-dehydrorhamnose reductase